VCCATQLVASTVVCSVLCHTVSCKYSCVQFWGGSVNIV